MSQFPYLDESAQNIMDQNDLDKTEAMEAIIEFFDHALTSKEFRMQMLLDKNVLEAINKSYVVNEVQY